MQKLFKLEKLCFAFLVCVWGGGGGGGGGMTLARAYSYMVGWLTVLI